MKIVHIRPISFIINHKIISLQMESAEGKRTYETMIADVDDDDDDDVEIVEQKPELIVIDDNDDEDNPS